MIATNEEEARAIVARSGGTVQAEDDGNELTEEALAGVTGGTGEAVTAQIGDKVYVNGPLYLTSYGDTYCGILTGIYRVQRYMPGRSKPYLLKSNVGWVDFESVTYVGP